MTIQGKVDKDALYLEHVDTVKDQKVKTYIHHNPQKGTPLPPSQHNG